MAETPPNGDTALPQPDAPAPDPPLRAGWFRFYFADERWEWSPEAAQIHGYRPGTDVTPTTALVMSHKHPDDYARMAAHLDRARRTHEAISTRHRIIDTNGQTREVVVVGQELLDDDGTVIGTTGFYIDATPDAQTPEKSTQARDQVLTDALSVIVESRSTIDQVKGMLMLIYGVDAGKAFDLLKWRSQETNVKLRLLAEQLAEDFLALTNDDQLPTRSRFDSVFLTAHQRVNDIS